MDDVLIIQNDALEGPGNLKRLLEQDGFKTRTVHAKKEPFPDATYRLLVILGGPQSANDRLEYLVDEQNLIRRHVAQSRPVLGICLGSQLVARSFGAPVAKGSTAEIGFYHDLHVDNSSDLFSGFSNPFTAFHWHQDAFGLGENAIRLVHSKNYPNQALQVGTAVGIQFHLEMTCEMIDKWTGSMTNSQRGILRTDSLKILADAKAYMPVVESNMERFYHNFKSKFDL